MKVAVIGAGPAGLAFSDKLIELRKDVSIDIYEKSNYIGGISKTINYKGNRIDIGGHRFFSKSDEVMKWWTNKFPIDTSTLNKSDKIYYQNANREIEGFKTVRDDNKTNNRIMLVRKRKSRILYAGKLYDYPLKLNLKTIQNIGSLNLINVGLSYLRSKTNNKKAKNLEDFIISRFGYKLYSMFFESYTEKVWGRHPKDISPEWGAQRIKGLSIRKVIINIFQKVLSNVLNTNSSGISQKATETSLIERFLYPKYGPGQMWEAVADDLKEENVNIFMNTPIIGIHFSTDNKLAEALSYRDKNGIIHNQKYDYIISTMPIKELIKSSTSNSKYPVFTNEILNIADSLPYRDFITVGLLINNISGPQNELLDDTWIYVQEPNVKVGRIQIFNNWSPYLVADNNLYWIGLEYFCNQNEELWNKSDDELINLAKKEIVDLNLTNSGSFIDSTVIREPKTYPAYFDSYERIDHLINSVNKIKNLYLIGRNGMHKYNNQDHSMLSGFRAAELIAKGNNDIKSKEELWKINAEQEYHEEVKK
tara:strand:- start:855 stop:2459 length:1605 start_codon:yes stop_codon:yes gene_type:complete